MKHKFSSFLTQKGRWLTAILFLLTLSVGQMWGADYTLSASTATKNDAADPKSHDWTFSTQTFALSPQHGGTGQTGYGDYIKFSKNKTYTITLPDGFVLTNVNVKGYTNSNGATNGEIIEVNGTSQSSKTFPAKDDSNLGSQPQITAGYDFAISQTGGTVTFKTANTNQLCVLITITGTPASSGPVDPTINTTAGAYTVGGTALDLTTCVSSNNTTGAFSFAVKTDGGTSASISGNNFSATAAGTCVVTATQAAVSGTWNEKSVDFNVVVSAPVAVTGITITPASPEVTVGSTVALSATIAPDNASDKTVTWSVQSGATYAEVSSTGVVTGLAEGSATIRATANDGSGVYADKVVTVAAALPPCFTFVPDAKSESVTEEGSSITTCTGGTMVWSKGGSNSSTLAYDATYGLLFGGSGSCNVVVTLNHLMQENTEIKATLVVDTKNTDARGLLLRDGTNSTNRATWTWVPSADKEEKEFTYKVKSSDGLIGTNVFRIFRSTNAYIKSLTVSNCGDPLYALTSAIDPVAADGKATITLSKTLVAAGATATATYSDIDAAYDFDEWVVSGATIDNAKANPVTITMGSTNATITLKLKTASVKYDVHFDSKGGSAVADQTIDAGGHASVPTAPTKFKYTFGGWSETDGGSTPADLSAIAINAEKTFYAIWIDKVCPTSGEVFSLVSDGTKAPGSNTYYPSTKPGIADLITYATVSGGVAQSVHATSSNNQVQIQASTAGMKLSSDDGYVRVLLECPLQAGDTIKIVKDNKLKITFDSLKTAAKTVQLASGTGANKDYYVVAAGFAGEDTIHVRKDGSNVTFTSLKVIRPEKYAVTFNMHGHGDQVAQQNILDGGKVTEPDPAPSASGWDFAGWYKTYVADPVSYSNPWDFDNDVVSAATELHAKWTEHAASSDATLSSLSYTIGGGDPIAIALEADKYAYAVELPMGTSVADVEVAAVANDPNAKDITIVQPTSVLPTATVGVTAEDNTLQNYTVAFTVATSKDIELVWATDKQRCDATTPSAKALIATASTYLSASYTGSASEGSALTTGKTAGSKIIITAKPGYAFKAMGFYGKIEDGTCNFYNDGVVETIGTSTGDACYADVFSNDEVHEFIIELTGSNGVYVRNMQLTIIEKCTPVTIAWDEEPVEYEVGKAGYALAATANNSGTVTYSTTNDAIVDVVAATGALTISGLGSATLKAATAEGDGTTYCANGGNNIEINKAVNTYYLIKFDKQNETSIVEQKFYSGDAAIAQPDEPSYPGHTFQGWYDAATAGNPISWPLTPTASRTIYAQWAAECTGPTITTQPASANYFVGRTAAALTCEATAGNEGALTYTWYSCDDAEMNNPVELAGAPTPSTAAVGTFYYFCTVIEAGCGVIRTSDVATINVTEKDKLCLIKATLQGGSTDPTLEGYLAQDSKASTQGYSSTYHGCKFGSNGNYVSLILSDGYSFQAGDVLNVNVGGLEGGAYATRVYVYGEANRGDSLTTFVQDLNIVGDNLMTLPAAVNNHQTIYLWRYDSKMNPYAAFVAVYRAYDKPVLTKITIGGASDNAVNQSTKAVSLEISAVAAADLEHLSVTPTFLSNDPAHTSGAVTSNEGAWILGANTYVVTDKDGDTETYIITLSAAAGIKEVVVSGDLDIMEGETTTLSAVVYDTNEDPASIQDVEWSIPAAEAEYATVSDAGVVTALKAGIVHVTATSVADGSKSATVNVVIAENPCRTWSNPDSKTTTYELGKLRVKPINVEDNPSITPYSGAAATRSWKLSGRNDKGAELYFSDGAQFESLTLGVASNGDDKNYTYTVALSEAAGDDFEDGFISVAVYEANDKNEDQALTNVVLPDGKAVRAVRIFRQYRDANNVDYGTNSSQYLYYIYACKKDFVPVTAVAVADGNLAIGKSLTLSATTTPTNADIASFVWTIESSTATGVTIDGNVLTAAAGATEGEVVVKVVATDVLSNVVNTTATISIVNKFEAVKLVTTTTTWDWEPVSVLADGPTISDPDTVLANYISGEIWEMLAGGNGDRPYRGSSYKAFQGAKLSFKAAVPGKLKIYAGRTSNDKKVYVNGLEVGTVTSTKAYLNEIVVPAGDVVITSEAMRIYWMKFDANLDPEEAEESTLGGYERDVTEGHYGTICLPKAGVMVGASIFEIAYYDAPSEKIFFDEVLNGTMVAGTPYIFLPDDGVSTLGVFYTDDDVEPAGSHNGLVGFIGASADEYYDIPDGDENYIIQNNQYREVPAGAWARVKSNRAYIHFADVPTNVVAPLPGRRRMSIGAAAPKNPTGLDELNAGDAPVKVMINGELFILRGEKMYDATGRLVK